MLQVAKIKRRWLYVLGLLIALPVLIAQISIPGMTETTTFSGSDIFYVVLNPATTPLSRKIQATNLLTRTSYIYLPVAGCNAATASLAFNDSGDGATAPTAACNDVGSAQRPTADFAGGAVNSMELPVNLPPTWTGGNIEFALRYYSSVASPTGNTEWDISTLCRTVGEAIDGTFNTVQTITDAQAAQNILNDGALSPLTTTGCAAGEDMQLRISRDGTNDSSNDLSKLLWVRLAVPVYK